MHVLSASGVFDQNWSICGGDLNTGNKDDACDAFSRSIMKCRPLAIAFQIAAIFAILGTSASFAQVSPASYYASKEGGRVLDKSTGLVWTRCVLGQTWNSGKCEGRPEKRTYKQFSGSLGSFVLEGSTGWRVPTALELAGLRRCPGGHLLTQGDNPVLYKCARNHGDWAAADPQAFPVAGAVLIDWYLSSTQSWQAGDGPEVKIAIRANGNGEAGRHPSNAPAMVRAVQKNQLSEEQSAIEYPTSIQGIYEQAAAEAERTRQAKAEEAARQRREWEERDSRERPVREAREAEDRRVRSEREARAAQERERRGCADFYPGKVGTIKGDGLFATKDQYVVRYVNNDRRTVTIEGTSGGNSLGFRETREFSCADLIFYSQ